jgi:predicted nucleic acid-binding protein
VTDYYADTSALIKRHVAEVGSEQVAFLAANHLFITSSLSQVEVYSALNRRVREGRLSAADYESIVADFEALCQTEYQLVEISAGIVNRTRQLLEQHPLRAYDAVQLATALLTNEALLVNGMPPLAFLCADDRLLTAASTAGLSTANPNTLLPIS